MTELELIVDFHRDSLRQGPGSEAETLQALKFTNLANKMQLKVADLGCGTGAQTFTLAKNLNAEITALDLFPEFLDELNKQAQKVKTSSKILTHQGSMDDLPFEDRDLDLIWSEGAIYNMGFEQGIRKWHPYLKTGGYLAVSEITWISTTRPREIEEFWMREYPEIDLASKKIRLLEENGYILSGYFYLNEKSWAENYYQPMMMRFEAFLSRHQNSALANKIIEDHQAEIDLYMKFKDYYSYGFYIARKND